MFKNCIFGWKSRNFESFFLEDLLKLNIECWNYFFLMIRIFWVRSKKFHFQIILVKMTVFPKWPKKRFSLRLPPCEPKNLLVSLVMTWLFQKLNLEFYTLHHRWYIYFVNNNLVFVNYPDSYPLHIKHVFSLNKIFLLPECIKGGFAFHFDAEKWVANGGVGARHQSERRPDFKGGATSLAHKWKNTMVQGHSTIESFDKLFKKFQTCPKMTASR